MGIVLAASSLVGSGLVFARLAYLGGTNTVTLQLFRFSMVVGLLLAYFWWKRVAWWLTGRKLRVLAGMSLSFVFAFLAFGAGIYLIGPSLTAILNNLEPVVAVVLSILVLHESFGPWQVVGGGLVMAGVVLAR